MARERMPDERRSVTRAFRLSPFTAPGIEPPPPIKIYLTVGLYDDGRPGELFVKVDRVYPLTTDPAEHERRKIEVSTLGGLVDAFAIAVSLGLQHGVPLDTFVEKYRGGRFEPAGRTGDPLIPMCTSVLDLIMRWLDARFGERAKALAKIAESSASETNGAASS